MEAVAKTSPPASPAGDSPLKPVETAKQAPATTIFAPKKRRSPLARLLVGLPVLAGLGGLAWFGVAHFRGAEEEPVYATAEIGRGDVVSRVSATGTLSPVVRVEVGSQVSGRIKELHADYNSQVEAGQVIARIDPQLFEGAVSQARARLTSARAGLERAQALAANADAHHRRIASLADIGAVPRAEVESSLTDKRATEAQVASARAEVTLARAGLEQAEVNLAYTTIASPIDGIVVSRSVDVGQTVAASLSAPTLFVIAGDLREMEVHTSVAEADVGQLAEGMRAEFTVDAFPDRTFQGVVKQVRYEAENVSNVVTYDAVVLVRNEDLRLRPGMTANVTFVIAEKRDVLTVPNRALRYRPPQAQSQAQTPGGGGRPEWAGRGGEGGPRAAGREGRGGDGERGARGERRRGGGETASGGERRQRRPQVVWVLRDGEPEPVRIQIGLADDANTEVTGGELQEGDIVIVGGGGAAGAEQAGPGGQPQRRRGPPRVF